MTKTEAINLFSSQKMLADALGITSAAISQWPENLTIKQTDWVFGAYVRTHGKPPTIPMQP
jgi:hypothetical protein